MDSSSTYQCRIATTQTERRQALELLYRAYRRKEFIAAHPDRIRETAWHQDPATEIVVVHQDSAAFMTATLVPDHGTLPADEVYPEAICGMRQTLSLMEVTSLAGCESLKGSCSRRALLALARFVIRHASISRYDALLQMVHPRHVRIYIKLLGYEVIGSGRRCQAVNNQPAVALLHRLERRDYPLAQTIHADPVCALEQFDSAVETCLL